MLSATIVKLNYWLYAQLVAAECTNKTRLTVGPWADVKIGFTRKIIIALKVRGGNGELKFS